MQLTGSYYECEAFKIQVMDKFENLNQTAGTLARIEKKVDMCVQNAEFKYRIAKIKEESRSDASQAGGNQGAASDQKQKT